MSRAQAFKRFLKSGAALAACASQLGLVGCSTFDSIDNREAVASGGSYQSQYRAEASALMGDETSSALNAQRCAPDSGPAAKAVSFRDVALDPELLSVGDLVNVVVGTDDTLSRNYKVAQDGALRLPHLPPIRALGRSVDAVQAELEADLVSSQLYATAPAVSVRLMDAAAARVFVSGAVFEPGAVTIGGTSGQNVDAEREKALGSFTLDRRLSRAVQSAGGARPDADLQHVALRRGGSTRIVDVRPALAGKPFADVVLLTGDQIDVPSRGCFQEALMVPSSFTAPGIKVYMSNLIAPVLGNAAAAVGKDTTELRYGTRMLQALVAMNCVGGAKTTNADRSAVLLTRNPMTGESIALSRSIEDMIQRADRDDYNPYLMNGDAIACYDSAVTNATDAAVAIGSVFGAAALTHATVRAW